MLVVQWLNLLAQLVTLHFSVRIFAIGCPRNTPGEPSLKICQGVQRDLLPIFTLGLGLIPVVKVWRNLSG